LRVLLDEMLSRRLIGALPKHEVEHSIDRGCGRISNGALISLAEEAGFEVLLTKDANIRYQQSLKGRRLALVVLRTHDQRARALVAMAQRIGEAIDQARPGQVLEVEVSDRPT
jgi:predicted nuclease of predicted toxin-antitoxin system